MRVIKENSCEFQHPNCGAGHLNICDMCYLRNIEGDEKIQELLGEVNSHIERLQDMGNNANRQNTGWTGKAYRTGKIHALREVRTWLRGELNG